MNLHQCDRCKAVKPATDRNDWALIQWQDINTGHPEMFPKEVTLCASCLSEFEHFSSTPPPRLK